MKKSRYTKSIIAILKQHEAGVKTADRCGSMDQRGDVLLRLQVGLATSAV